MSDMTDPITPNPPHGPTELYLAAILQRLELLLAELKIITARLNEVEQRRSRKVK